MLSSVELCWVLLIWAVLNCVELCWVVFIWVVLICVLLSWVMLSWAVFIWVELCWVKLCWLDLNCVDLNWVVLGCIVLSCVDLIWVGLYAIMDLRWHGGLWTKHWNVCISLRSPQKAQNWSLSFGTLHTLEVKGKINTFYGTCYQDCNLTANKRTILSPDSSRVDLWTSSDSILGLAELMGPARLLKRKRALLQLRLNSPAAEIPISDHSSSTNLKEQQPSLSGML